jgi:hypothetical protein
MRFAHGRLAFRLIAGFMLICDSDAGRFVACTVFWESIRKSGLGVKDGCGKGGNWVSSVIRASEVCEKTLISVNVVVAASHGVLSSLASLSFLSNTLAVVQPLVRLSHQYLWSRFINAPSRSLHHPLIDSLCAARSEFQFNRQFPKTITQS